MATVDIQNGERQNTPACPNCNSAEYRKTSVHRINAFATLVARGIGFVALIGALYGIMVALSGFGGHYGAYPRLQLIVHSLLVGLGILAVSLVVGLGGWRLLGKKKCYSCAACGHLAQRE